MGTKKLIKNKGTESDSIIQGIITFVLATESASLLKK